MSTEQQKARILVIGAGGVGTMAAYALEKGGRATVTAVLRSNYAQVKAHGFTIHSIDHGDVEGWRPSEVLDHVPDVAKEGLPPFDFVVVTTKNVPDVPPSVADLVAPAVTPALTTIVLLQNGLNIEKPVLARFPTNAVLSGVSLIGAAESPAGVVHHEDHDILMVGAFGPAKEASSLAAQRFVDMYGACGGTVQCRYDAEVRACRWRKLLYNSSFNSVAAILGLDTTRMRFTEHIVDELLRPIMQEIAAAALAVDGVKLPATALEHTITIDPWAAFLKPSMMQDMEKGNFIEFENIVGEPLREAERHGVPTPTLKTVYAILKGLQWRTKEARGVVVVPKENNPALKYGNKD